MQHTSVKTRRGKQKHTRNKTSDEKAVVQKTKVTVKKFKSKLVKLRNLGIQCNLVPTDADKAVLKEIKTQINVKAKETVPSTLEKLDKKQKSQIKLKKTVLGKSLDSVKMLMSKMPDVKQEQTQTNRLRPPKKGKTAILKGGIVKKKPLKLDSATVKKIARELVRTRGDPLINLLPSQTKRSRKLKAN